MDWDIESVKLFLTNLWNLTLLLEFAVTALALAVAFIVALPLKKWLLEKSEKSRPFISLVVPAIWFVLQWGVVLGSQELVFPFAITRIIASLLTAWLAIRLMSALVRDPVLSQSVAVVVWTVAALDIVGVLDHVIAVLERLSLDVGELHISIFDILKGGVTIALLLWIAITLSRIVEKKIRNYSGLEPSLRVLFSKVVKFTFISVAILTGLASVGFDMSLLAVMGGMIGVGIGFGLQKVVSNFVCGIILLLDRSIKPGDVIALNKGSIYGTVNKLGSRCVSIRTRSGKEHLIPNEDIITQKVENWSYTDHNVRLKIPVGVDYGSDIDTVQNLLLDAAQDIDRVLKSPTPGVRLMRFGDNSLDFELRVWIGDPENGINNVKSSVCFRIWEKFCENDITIPFPQRDVHIRTDIRDK